MTDKIEIDKREDRVGTARQEFVEKLEKVDPSLAEAFQGQTEEQKIAGKLMGKLMLARGNDDIEKSFAWYDEEIKVLAASDESVKPIQLDYHQRMLAMFVALEHGGANDLPTYNACRKILVTANTRS